MAEIECPRFTESVACEIDGKYKIAQGWTQSTGQSDPWKYNLPEGWQYDARYFDIVGAVGSHGGCRNCMMTLVHLITIDPVTIDPCEGIVCQDVCDGYDLWSQKCLDGTCVNDTLIEHNSSTCGYVEIDEPEWYGVFIDNAGYIIFFALAGVAINEIAKR